MQRNVRKQAEKYLRWRKKWKKWQKVVMTMACVVVFCTVYALILPAITANSKTSCGYEEHIHTDKCVEKELICDISEKTSVHTHSDACVEVKKELSCGLEETSGHTHGDGCYVTAQTQVCGLEESEEHTHNDACFQSEQKLNCTQKESDGHAHTDACYKEVSTYVCGLEEGQETGKHEHTDKCYKIVDKCDKKEHEHKLACFSDPDADVETREIWERTFEDIELTGDWSEDLIAIAESQLGYEESTENYVVENDKKRGYTRYGEWYGNEYGHWCAMYVSFCLNYAEVEGIPFEAGCQNWINTLSEEPYELYREAKEYTPVRGDLVFFNWDKEPDSDHVGIVVEYIEATEYEPAQIKTIEGNASNTVKYKEYDANAVTIMGYGQLPEEPKDEFTEEVEVPEEVVEEITETTVAAVIFEDNSYNTKAEDETIITVTGMLPEGVEVKAYPIELELKGQDVIYAYDITMFLADGNVYELAEDAPVTVKIFSPDYVQDEDSVEPGMYYIPEEGEPEPVGSTIEEDGVSFTAEHFSVYALMAPKAANVVSTQYELKNAIDSRATTIQLRGNFGVYINTDDGDNYGHVDGPLTIPANTDITIDLNGYTIWQHGSAALFDVKNGATLTIMDSRAPAETIENGGGALYGRNATLTEGSNNYATLTYYVTTSRVIDSETGATAEAVGKHTVTTKGAIVAGDETVFNVTNGTLNINSGMIRSGVDRAITQTGGTVNITGGYICDFSQPYDASEYKYGTALKYSAKDFGGAIHSTGGTVNLSSNGVIAANNAALGGAIYVGNNAVLNIAGGYISGNQALYDCKAWKGENDEACVGGGGIVANGTINMSAGYITHNTASGSQYFDGGGGLLLKTGSTMLMTGGYITGNKAQAGGGLKTTFGGRVQFVMTSGDVSANVATAAEGGGIALDRGAVGTIQAEDNACYITNNHILETVHWGGGGLFCADGSTLNIKNALVTNNTAGGFGAGVAGCPTGHLYLYVTQGCAVYDNRDVVHGEPHFVNGGAKDEIDVKVCTDKFQQNGHADFFCALQSTVTNQILGSGYAQWQGTADQQTIQAHGDEVLAAKEVMGLKANPSEADKLAAQKYASVYINGNYSYTHGGGIMCNGNLVVGEPDDVEIPVHLNIQGTKEFVSNAGGALSLKDNTFLFTVTDQNGMEVAEGRCDENGKITFDKQIVLKQEGTFVYEIKEKVPENAESDIQYDSTKYKVFVTVKRGEGVKWYGDTYKYTYEISNLKVTKQNGNGTEENVSINTATQSGVITVLPNREQIGFTNIKTDIIDMRVIKNWIGKESNIDSITVKLYRNDEVIDTNELNNSNNWQYTWSNLPTKDDRGNAYTYHVEEEHVDGYISTSEEINEAVIHTTNITNTNIKDAKFKLDLTKVSEEEPELTLAGAEFELIDRQGNRVSFIGENGVYTASETTGNGTKTTVITVEGGKLLLKEIPAGTYILREIKAPEGYGLMDDVEITLDEFTEPTVELVLEDPEKTYVIPETGGNGTNMFTTGGILLMMSSLLIGFTVKRKRERGYR